MVDIRINGLEDNPNDNNSPVKRLGHTETKVMTLEELVEELKIEKAALYDSIADSNATINANQAYSESLQTSIDNKLEPPLLSPRGTLLCYDGAGWINIEPGTNGQVLSCVDGVPTWVDAATAPVDPTPDPDPDPTPDPDPPVDGGTDVPVIVTDLDYGTYTISSDSNPLAGTIQMARGWEVSGDFRKDLYKDVTGINKIQGWNLRGGRYRLTALLTPVDSGSTAVYNWYHQNGGSVVSSTTMETIGTSRKITIEIDSQYNNVYYIVQEAGENGVIGTANSWVSVEQLTVIT